MLKSYIKSAFRNITGNKLTSFVNITGLALGIATFLLLMEYISLEKSVNKFHANLSQLYRLINKDPAGKTWPEVEPGWASIVKQRFSEIEGYCRFDEESGRSIIYRKDRPNESFSETKTGYADGNFFGFFSFPLLQGEALALNKPDVVFISKSIAAKYFGNSDPLNQFITVNNQFGKKDYTVGGVYEDMRENSDIRFNMIFSLATLNNPANLNGNDWAATDKLNAQYIYTFLRLRKNADINSLEKKLSGLRTLLKKDKDGIDFRLQSLADMHLGSTLNDAYPTYGNRRYIYMLGIISFLILLIAWFNYINLFTANSFKRSNEVGVRKVIGANKNNLVLQFLSETILINLLALVLGFILAVMLQPLFNNLVNRNLTLISITGSASWWYAPVLLIVGSLLAGYYCAHSMAGFRPVDTLKGKITKTVKGILLRKSLVVAQFIISIVLMIVTIVIYSQLRYMQNKKLGLNANQLLVIRGPQVGGDSILIRNKSYFKNVLTAEPFVQSSCVSGTVPTGNYNFTTSGFTQALSKPGDELKGYSFAIIGNNYFETYQIPLVAGRNFTNAECNVAWNDNSKVMMNETAIRQLGFTNPQDALNTRIQWDERKIDIIGVVKDYNHNSVQRPIDPVIFYPQNNSSYFTIRLTPDNMETKLKKLQTLYSSSFQGNPFEYFFVDENFSKLYVSETQYGHIFASASLCAILIACLGLFGLVRFTVEQRTKEIGVRKVLGANILNIVSLLSGDFLVLVFLAFILASPIAWYFTNEWLKDFAWRIHVSGWIFLIAFTLAMVIAIVTISSQAIKAALANPVTSLRSE